MLAFRTVTYCTENEETPNSSSIPFRVVLSNSGVSIRSFGEAAASWCAMTKSRAWVRRPLSSEPMLPSWTDKETWELYDLAADSHERRNLFHDPSSAALRSRLEALLQSRPPVTEDHKLPYSGVA